MALIRSFPPGAVQTSSGLVRGVAGGGFEDVASSVVGVWTLGSAGSGTWTAESGVTGTWTEDPSL